MFHSGWSFDIFGCISELTSPTVAAYATLDTDEDTWAVVSTTTISPESEATDTIFSRAKFAQTAFYVTWQSSDLGNFEPPSAPLLMQAASTVSSTMNANMTGVANS